MKTAILLIVLLVSTPSFAADEWTTQDTILQSVYTMLHVVDWGQTYNFTQRQDQDMTTGEVTIYTESNPIMGNRPHRDTVNIYFATSLVAHAAISYTLPRPWREYWQGFGIGLEASMVGWNASLGYTRMF